MKKLSLLILVLILAGTSCAAEEERFPELKPCDAPPAGYDLIFRDGPDFYVWVLEPDAEPKGRATAILYVGTYPTPNSFENAERVGGNLAGEPTVWSNWTSESFHKSEALLDYKHDDESLPVTLHSVVKAESLSELTVLKEWVSSITLCQREID